MFGFQITILIHAAFISLTILAALTFKPIQGQEIKVSRDTMQIEEDAQGFGFPNLVRCQEVLQPTISLSQAVTI